MKKNPKVLQNVVVALLMVPTAYLPVSNYFARARTTSASALTPA